MTATNDITSTTMTNEITTMERLATVSLSLGVLLKDSTLNTLVQNIIPTLLAYAIMEVAFVVTTITLVTKTIFFIIKHFLFMKPAKHTPEPTNHVNVSTEEDVVAKATTICGIKVKGEN